MKILDSTRRDKGQKIPGGRRGMGRRFGEEKWDELKVCMLDE